MNEDRCVIIQLDTKPVRGRIALQVAPTPNGAGHRVVRRLTLPIKRPSSLSIDAPRSPARMSLPPATTAEICCAVHGASNGEILLARTSARMPGLIEPLSSTPNV